MNDAIERVARAMAEAEGDGWSKPRSHWLRRAETALKEVDKLLREADLVFYTEAEYEGQIIEWNAAPAVLEIFNSGIGPARAAGWQ